MKTYRPDFDPDSESMVPCLEDFKGVRYVEQSEALKIINMQEGRLAQFSEITNAASAVGKAMSQRIKNLESEVVKLKEAVQWVEVTKDSYPEKNTQFLAAWFDHGVCDSVELLTLGDDGEFLNHNTSNYGDYGSFTHWTLMEKPK